MKFSRHKDPKKIIEMLINIVTLEEIRFTAYEIELKGALSSAKDKEFDNAFFQSFEKYAPCLEIYQEHVRDRAHKYARERADINGKLYNFLSLRLNNKSFWKQYKRLVRHDDSSDIIKGLVTMMVVKPETWRNGSYDIDYLSLFDTPNKDEDLILLEAMYNKCLKTKVATTYRRLTSLKFSLDSYKKLPDFLTSLKFSLDSYKKSQDFLTLKDEDSDEDSDSDSDSDEDSDSDSDEDSDYNPKKAPDDNPNKAPDDDPDDDPNLPKP